MSNDPNDYDAMADDDLLDNSPGWPKAVGLLSIVFGSIAFTCGAFNGVSPLVFKGMVEAQLDGDPLPPGFEYTPLMIAGIGIGLIWNGLLVIAGAATLLRKPAGRTLHLAYAVLVIPVLAFTAWMAMTQITAMAQWVEDYPDNPFAQQQR